MRTKCRRLFQDAAAAASAQSTSVNSRLGESAVRPPCAPHNQKDAPGRASVHYQTIKSGSALEGSGAGSGSEYRTVSRDTARVSAT